VCQEYEGIELFANCSVRGTGQGTSLLKVCNKRGSAKVLDVLEKCKFKRMQLVSVLSET
jgi:hypothetical protein